MARICAITGKKPMAGHLVSKSHRKTKHWQRPNLQTKRIYEPELGRFVRVRLSVHALRTVTKLGLLAYLRKIGKTLKDIT